MGLLNIIFGNSTNQISEYIDKNAILLDVRTDSEYRSHHIEKAVNIPVQELEYRVDEITKLKKPVIVYCASGMRSAKATNFLKSAGVDAINGGGIAQVKASL